MALVTKVREKREIPHEPGEWMVLQKLSFRQLEDASETMVLRTRERLRAFGGDLYKAIRESNREEIERQTGIDPEDLDDQVDPLAQYDTFTLLRHGIHDWSYDEKLNDTTRAQLDEETSEWAAREILKLAKPELFADEDDEGGNAGAFSSNSSMTGSDLATTLPQ